MTKIKVFVIGIFLLTLTGCSTVKGPAAEETQGTAQGTVSQASSIQKGAACTWGAISKLDQWIKDNLW